MSLNPLDYSISSLNRLLPKKGRLLIAEPFMQDSFFKRSVVLLTEYNENGVVGFILNQPLEQKIHEAVKDFPIFDAPIFMGGPVQTDRLFFIHSQAESIPESELIIDHLWWSGNFNHLKLLIENEQIFPHEVMFFIGYSGWDVDQLKDEMKNNSWIISKADELTINDFKADKLWQTLLSEMGPKHKVLSNFPHDPSLN